MTESTYSAENKGSWQPGLLSVAASCREPHVGGIDHLNDPAECLTRRKHEIVSLQFLSDPELFSLVLTVYLHYL